MKKTLLSILAVAASIPAIHAASVIQITEWMYNPGSGSGEFIEITNMGTGAVDLTGWSFSDNARDPGAFSLSGLGTLQAGQSAIITEVSASTFRTNWGLGALVKIAGSNTANLGRSDEINIYDADDILVDRLTYNDQGSGNVDAPRTQGASGWAPQSALGINNASVWILSTATDGFSITATSGDIGNPGYYQFAPVPEPSTYALIGLALAGFLIFRRRNKRAKI